MISIFKKQSALIRQIDKHPLKNFIYEEVGKLYKKIGQLEDAGTELDRKDIARLSEFFFQAGKGYYVGIESNLPSTYFELYPAFLHENKNYLKTLGDTEKSKTKRILIARSGGEMRTDAIIHPLLYKDFIEWHHKNGMGLYWIDHDAAEKIRAKNGVETTDTAFWSNAYAVTFQTHQSKKKIGIRLLRSSKKPFSKIKSYVDEVVKAARPLTFDIDQLPIISEEVVKKWEGYIGSSGFRDKGIGVLLRKELSKRAGCVGGRVLDAAAGSGYETVLLTKSGYDLTSNEIDPAWNLILKNKLREHDLPLELYQHDWRNLSDKLQPLYGAIIAVGNSLCMVIGEEQRRRALAEFYRILKPGGKVIIDERNFELILRKLKNGEKYYAKGVMYDCNDMNASLSIEDGAIDLVRFNFFDTKTDKVLGSTVVQAPKPGELHRILQDVGFNNIKVYSDFKEGLDKKAGLFTYIATK